jgi:hypothetical protein
MGQPFGTAGMAAIASQFHSIAGVITILATIFAVAGRNAVASWMGAFLSFCHRIDISPKYDGCAAISST